MYLQMCIYIHIYLSISLSTYLSKYIHLSIKGVGGAMKSLRRRRSTPTPGASGSAWLFLGCCSPCSFRCKFRGICIHTYIYLHIYICIDVDIDLNVDAAHTWTPTVCKILAFGAVFRGLRLLFYRLLGSR